MVAKYPLQERPLLLGETESLAVALKIPCLIWPFGKTGEGYGAIKTNGKMQSVHRIAFIFAYKLDPGEFLVCHHCDTRQCYNPHHLFKGTSLDNTRDMMLKGRNRGLSMTGSSHPLSVYSKSDVVAIRSEYNGKYGCLKRLSDKFGGTPTAIYFIVNNKTWRHI